MGEVWRAQDQILGREVAIKLMLSTLSDTEMLERFRREAVIAASLQHPGITVVHDAGWHEGQLFLVMELLSGQDLRAILTESPSGLAPARAMIIAGQTAGALAAVHERGIVHRDLKPENLFIQPGDRVKIGDFGIARDEDMTTLTAVGRPMGTPLYMAPERWDGLPATTATDLYALGCVLYEMLTGEPPFSGGLTAVITQHLQVIPQPPRERHPELPGRLNDLVMALLAKDPARRPPSAAVVSSALRRMLRDLLAAPDHVASAPPPAPPAPPPAPARVTAALGCVWSSRGGFDTFFTQNAPATLAHSHHLPNGECGGWQAVPLPEGQVSALAVAAARAVTNWDRATYEYYRGLAVAVGGTVFHSLQSGEAGPDGGAGGGTDGGANGGADGGANGGADGGWSVWEAMRPLDARVVDLAFAAHSMPRHWDVFALDASGRVHHRALSGDADWSALPGPQGRPVTAIAACYGQVPELVAVAGGDVWRTRQFQSGRWQDWEAVLRPPAPAVDVALSPLAGDGELYVLDQSGQVHYESLAPSPSAEGGPAPASMLPGLPGPVSAIAASLMLTQGRDRRQVLCALAADGTLHYTTTTLAGRLPATWSPWHPL